MCDTTLILLAAGNATRFDMPVLKQWLYTGDRPLWVDVAERFEKTALFGDIIVVGNTHLLDYMKTFKPDYTYVAGGEERQLSLRNALRYVTTPYVLVHDTARCCVPESMIRRIVAAKTAQGCVVPYQSAVDTAYLDDRPIERNRLRMIQTPQLSDTALLTEALQSDTLFTDESSAIQAVGGNVIFVEGSPLAHKLTRLSDIEHLPCLKPPVVDIRTGFGIDTHAFEEGKTMKLCGVSIDAPMGFKAHSDGDVAIHALIDALLGAAGMGDIGELFPDTDAAYAGADSVTLLKTVLESVYGCGFALVNVDMTIVAQTPKLQRYKNEMRYTLAQTLGISAAKVNIKATTSEKLGFIGRKEGVTVHAVANLRYYPWKEKVL